LALCIHLELPISQRSESSASVDSGAERLGADREEASFAKAGAEIRVRWGRDAPSSIDRYEREEVGRIAILETVRKVCEQAPELRSDWFAVGADL
jgi:hypothetical protein